MIPKYDRILRLKGMDFNTPRMFYADAEFLNGDIKLLMKLNKFLAEQNHQTFGNIRTYKYTGLDESWSSAHHIYVDKSNILDTLIKSIKDGYTCMIDMENPKNGIYSGNIQINNDLEGSFILEYVHKPEGGAMVRDADQHISGTETKLNGLPSELRWVVNQAFNKFTLDHKSVILEWTIGEKESGEQGKRLIWWEYRDLKA